MMNLIVGYFLRLYIRFCGIRAKIATTEYDLANAFELRKKVYEEANYSNELHYPDEYDAHSIIINAYKENQVIGSMRLSAVAKGAFCFDLCNPKIPAYINHADIIEYGALVVDKRYRKSNSLIFIALTEAAFRVSIQNKFKYWYGFSILQQIEHFKKINPYCTILETNPSTSKSFANQKRFRQYFEKYNAISKPFLFELEKVNYMYAILLLIKGSIKKRRKKR